MATDQDLRILILDDVPTDADLMVFELKRAGITLFAKRVDQREQFVDALESFKPDVILLDYSLPHFNGRDAMRIARTAHPEIPIIIVTGTIGDEPAIDLMKSGAKDYVLKGNLVRLPMAVRRALSEEQGIRNRKRAERELREAHALLTNITDTSPVGITVWGSAGVITFANPEALRLLSRSHEELSGLMYNSPVWQITDFDGAPIVDAELPFRKAFDTGKQIRSVKMEIAVATGRRKLSVNAAPLQSESGAIAGIVATLEDVTQLVASEELLRRRAEHLRLALTSAQMATWVLEYPGEALSYTDGALAIFGLAAGESVPDLNAFLKLVHPEDREFVSYRLRNAIHDRQEYGVDFRIVWPNGEVRWASSKGDVVYDEWGKPIRILGVVWDITGRKESEIALNRANKALHVLSGVNEQLIQAQDERALLNAVCRVIVEIGGYRLAWVGKAMHDARKSVVPVAHFGQNGGFVENILITWDESEHGHGPTGTAIRTRQVQVVSSVTDDPRLAPWHDEAIRRGYRSWIALPLEDANGVFGSLTIYASEEDAFLEPEIKLMKELADDLAFGIASLHARAERDRFLAEQQKQQARLQQSLVESIKTLAAMLEVRDPYTAGHQERVARLAEAIAHEMELDQDRIEGLRLAASIHDIGKIRAPAEILNKPGKLDEIEFSLIKMHSQIGYDILKDIQFPWPIARIVLEHHERLDGSGYPNGLHGEQILLESRILSVADVVEAMTSHRPYRPGLGCKAALEELMLHRGTWYDGAVVDACLCLFSEGRFRFDASNPGLAA